MRVHTSVCYINPLCVIPKMPHRAMHLQVQQALDAFDHIDSFLRVERGAVATTPAGGGATAADDILPPVRLRGAYKGMGVLLHKAEHGSADDNDGAAIVVDSSHRDDDAKREDGPAGGQRA